MIYYIFISSDDQMKEGEVGGVCRTHGETKNSCKLVKSVGKRTIGNTQA